MSLGYAERLSFREDLGGRLGAPEIHQSARAVLEAAAALARLLAEAERVVVFTGAGISTACGVPDFRGPNGVWTLQRAGRPLPRLQTSFAYAQPSFTHMVGRTMGLGEEGGESAAASHGMGWDGMGRPTPRFPGPLLGACASRSSNYCEWTPARRSFCSNSFDPLLCQPDASPPLCCTNRRCSRCCAPAR